MLSLHLKKAAKILWLLPAVLLWASFPPLGETTNVFFALAPLVWFSRNRSPRASFRIWFLNGFFFWTATLSWMPAIVKNGGPWQLVLLGWVGLAAYCALYFGAFGYLSSAMWGKVGQSYARRILAIVVAEPVLWAGLEIVRSYLFGGFAWNELGVAGVNASFFAPLSVGGVYLAGALAVLVNGTVASIAERVLAPWQARMRTKPVSPSGEIVLHGGRSAVFAHIPRWVRSVETLLPVLAAWALHAVGAHFGATDEDASGKTLKVALVQRNFPCVFNYRHENPYNAYHPHLKMAALHSPDLMVLPESAFCEFGDLDSAAASNAASWFLATADAKALIAGGSRTESGKLFNSAALYLPRKDAAGMTFRSFYDKVHLVPFGEYIPGDKIVTALQKLAPVGSCSPGELKLLDANGVDVGVAICFEDTDSAQMRKLASMGADVLVFITNDSWFCGSDETVQHAWQAVARAMETGLTVLRVGNSGVTGVVYPTGESSWLESKDGSVLVDRSGCKLEHVKLYRPRSGLTVYARLGDWPLFSAFLLVLAVSFGPGIAGRLRS